MLRMNDANGLDLWHVGCGWVASFWGIMSKQARPPALPHKNAVIQNLNAFHNVKSIAEQKGFYPTHRKCVWYIVFDKRHFLWQKVFYSIMEDLLCWKASPLRKGFVILWKACWSFGKRPLILWAKGIVKQKDCRSFGSRCKKAKALRKAIYTWRIEKIDWHKPSSFAA